MSLTLVQRALLKVADTFRTAPGRLTRMPLRAHLRVLAVALVVAYVGPGITTQLGQAAGRTIVSCAVGNPATGVTIEFRGLPAPAVCRELLSEPYTSLRKAQPSGETVCEVTSGAVVATVREATADRSLGFLVCADVNAFLKTRKASS
jgi:hypothetical protein